MEPNKGPTQQQINIEIPDSLEATYANFCVITHSASEVIIDFARILPNAPKGKVYARVVMTPMNAKLLQQALATNLQKFEAQFGEIKLPDKDSMEGHALGFRH
jgi:hypothetical protein